LSKTTTPEGVKPDFTNAQSQATPSSNQQEALQMQLNLNQIMAIIVAILSVLITSTAQLTDLFGAGTAKNIVSVAGLMNSLLSSVLAVLSSQGATVKSVLAMPGVQKIDVNADANKTLAAIAVDPAQNKIGPTPEAISTVTQTAKGN
jgi:hypothetical protein